MKKIEVPEDRYNEIGELIHSASSPVGIDARHTHILILHMLSRIEERLQRLEVASGVDPVAEPPEKPL
ncbi:MAG: hypothetical protein VYE73_07120 [Acidobacteriota bacterium]|nr:hypothetical protein [Acidobacteriota bacterium]